MSRPAVAGAIDHWPSPINLFGGLAAAPLTAHDVPPVIGDYASTFARAGGFDPTGAIAAATVATAAMIDDGIRLLLPGASSHFQSARLWVANIGSPGTGKSPTQRTMLTPAFDVHRDLVAASQREREAAKDDAERTPQRALLTSDCTVDKLSELLSDNPRGILYCVDELDSWLGQHEAFGREGATRNRGEWMRLFDGGPHQVDRVKRGSYFVPNWGASLLTATTPAALGRLAKKLPADGLIQRFLLFSVQPMQERDRALFAGSVDIARKAYEQRLRGLYGLSAGLFEKPIVRLSAEAIDAYEAEERRLRTLIEAAETVGDGFASHVAKHPAMLARVALTFHAASDEMAAADGTPRHPCDANISFATMQLAVRFMRCAYQHAHVIYSGCLGSNTPLELAKAIARSLLADELDIFNRREITHTCRAFRSAPEWQRTGALRALEDYGWIEGETFLPEHGSRWTVNPRVHNLFAAERDRHRARRRTISLALRGGDDGPEMLAKLPRAGGMRNE
jgi:hypothetical protein